MIDEQKDTARASAIKDRRIIYLAVFRELSERFGEVEAISVMRSASRAHGAIVGETLIHLAPRDVVAGQGRVLSHPNFRENLILSVNSSIAAPIANNKRPLPECAAGRGCRVA